MINSLMSLKFSVGKHYHTLWKDITSTKPALLLLIPFCLFSGRFRHPAWRASVLPTTDKQSRTGEHIQGQTHLISTHLVNFSS